MSNVMAMRSSATVPAPITRQFVLCATVAAVVLSVASVALVVARVPSDEVVPRALVEVLIIGVPIGAGLYAMRANYQLRFGIALMGSGYLWSLTALGESAHSLPYSIGRVSAWLIFPELFYLMLSFPDGRIRGRFDRALFAAAATLLAGLFLGSALVVSAYPAHTPWASCLEDCPANAFMVLDAEPRVFQDVLQPAREVLTTALVTAITVSMVYRWRRATPLRRRTMGPVVAMGAALNLLLALFYVVRRRSPDGDAAQIVGILWSLCIPGIAAAFMLGLLRRRLLLGRVLAQLSATLAGSIEPRRLRSVLSGALGDPGLEVLTPDGDTGAWNDTAGRRWPELPPPADGWEVAVVPPGQPAVAAIFHDRELSGDPDLLDAVGALVAAGLSHERMTSALATSLAELEESRRRIAVAADLERSRIERDLHDGAQQRLVTLRIRLSLAEELLRSDPGAGARAIGELGGEIERTLDELRSLAHGVYPGLLSDRGLDDALRNVAIEAPVRVQYRSSGLTRYRPELEIAVYFTCVEALQNVEKHAPRAQVWMSVRHIAGGALVFEVRDDGPGFPVDAVAGDGLRNMRDRIEAVGGRLEIHSAPGLGTRVRGALRPGS